MNPSRLRLKSRATLLACLSVAAIISMVMPALALLPFPYSANQSGLVTCLENTNYSYIIYLPPEYTTNTPLPILYTMAPGGGGMVSTFQEACLNFKTICVGITSTHS